jgi:hypothetical protein
LRSLSNMGQVRKVKEPQRFESKIETYQIKWLLVKQLFLRER